MTHGGLQIIKPGVLSLIQDLGRHHYQHLGLTTGGAADEQAFCWANRLLDNAPNSPALEICYGGLQLIAQAPCVIAITGADCHVTINDQPVENWQTHLLNTGDLLSFGHPQRGIRTYLAVSGGFFITPTLGSVATVIREKFGGLDGLGSPLQAGDILPCHESANIAKRQVPPDFIPDYQAPLTLRMIKNPQKKLFSEQALVDLATAQYQISAQSNQMGVRLQGPAIKPQQAGIISEGMAFGAVQIPADGQPIVLLKDRQTIGGYPVIGWVLTLDAFLLAQQTAGKPIKFSVISLAESQQILRDFYRFFRKN